MDTEHPRSARPDTDPNTSGLRTLPVDGAALAYETRGDGPPVVLVPGSLCDLRVWSGLVAHLAARYRVVAYSRRYTWPHSPRSEDADGSLDRQVEDVAELVASLRIAPAHVIGHSFGGAISVMLALRRPDLVRSLVLVEPSVESMLRDVPGADDAVAEARALNEALRQVFDTGDTDTIVATFMERIAPGTLARMPPELRQMLLSNVAAAKVERRTPRPRFTCNDARGIRARTLVLAGELSPKMFHHGAHSLARCLGQGDVQVVPGASHFVQFDQPAAFNEAVSAFLAGA